MVSNDNLKVKQQKEKQKLQFKHTITNKYEIKLPFPRQRCQKFDGPLVVMAKRSQIKLEITLDTLANT